MSVRRAISFALFATLFAQPCLAEEQAIKKTQTYEKKVTDSWQVRGFAFPNHERNDVCVAFKEWKDGSKIELVKDLKTGELRIWNQNMGWSRLSDEKTKTYSLRMNMHDQQGNVVDGGNIEYKLINKNTIVMPQLQERRFLKDFINSNRIDFIPEGDVSNIRIFLDGNAIGIVMFLVDCAQSAGKLPPVAGASTTETDGDPKLVKPVRADVD